MWIIHKTLLQGSANICAITGRRLGGGVVWRALGFPLFLIQDEILSNVCMRCSEAIKEPSCLRLCACPTLLELIFHVALQWTTSTHKSTLWALLLRSQAGRFHGNVLNMLNETDIKSWWCEVSARAFHFKTRLMWPGRKQKQEFYYTISVPVSATDYRCFKSLIGHRTTSLDCSSTENDYLKII